VGFACEAELAALIAANNAYLAVCPGMEPGCGEDEANALIVAGMNYNDCMDAFSPELPTQSKNLDKMKDRNKKQGGNG